MTIVGIEEAIVLLEEAQTHTKRYAYAVFLLRIAVAEKLFALSKYSDCPEALETISAEVERFGDMETKVYQMLAHMYGLY